jgi:hypothetical protein
VPTIFLEAQPLPVTLVVQIAQTRSSHRTAKPAQPCVRRRFHPSGEDNSLPQRMAQTIKRNGNCLEQATRLPT